MKEKKVEQKEMQNAQFGETMNINNLNVIAKASAERKAVITMEISDIKEGPSLHRIKGKVAHRTGSIPAKCSG